MNHSTLEIINILKEKEEDFLNIKSFSSKPGIYAIFFIGDDFPILGNAVKKHQIIYIGKTEKSQDSRDAKTHFASGKTGSSTIRKSIGSLLYELHNLIPIPRNDTDYLNGRNSHFMFYEPSEEIITEWMQNNLALSFYEYPKSKKAIDTLETEIIQQLIPLLNIDYKNPHNPFMTKIKSLREICANHARESVGLSIEKPIKSKTIQKSENIKITPNMNTNFIIINNITATDTKSKIIRITVENKFLFPTEKIGEPNEYKINFIYDKKSYITSYTIGSWDGRSRSGVLKLGNELYLEKLKIKSGTKLKISKQSDNIYAIELI
jgi:hypothetical protein